MSFSATPSGPLTEVCEWNFFPPFTAFLNTFIPTTGLLPPLSPRDATTEYFCLNLFWFYFFVRVCVFAHRYVFGWVPHVFSPSQLLFTFTPNSLFFLSLTLWYWNISYSDRTLWFFVCFFSAQISLSIPYLMTKTRYEPVSALYFFFTCKNHPPLSLQSRLSFSFLLCSTYSKLQFWFSQVFAPVLSRGPESNRRFLRSDVVELHNIKKK